MTSEAPDINWQDILDEFYLYDGTIVDFCKQNNIKPHQLYYQRKRANRSDTPKFHAITLKENLSNKASNEKTILPKSNLASDIKIEIGKATIHVPGDNKEALSNIFFDETVLKVLDYKGKESKKQKYMWLYKSPDENQPIIIYNYQKTRSGSCPKKFLSGFSGYLQTDGYAGYNKVENVKRLYCLAHIRRKFHEIIVNLD